MVADFFALFLSISRSFVRSPSNLSNARKNTKMPSLHSTLFGFKVKPKPRCVKTARNVAFAFTLKSNTVNSVFVVQLYYSYNRKKGHFMRLEIKRKWKSAPQKVPSSFLTGRNPVLWRDFRRNFRIRFGMIKFSPLFMQPSQPRISLFDGDRLDVRPSHIVLEARQGKPCQIQGEPLVCTCSPSMLFSN